MQQQDLTAAEFRRLSQADKDAAYNNSLAVADSAERLRYWEERSGDCRNLASSRTDIRYGPEPANCFDYFPTGRPGEPLFVFIHGGYWQRNSKDVFGFVSTGPLAHGVNVATIGYTLAPNAGLSQMVEEVFRAIGFIADRADTLGFDAGRIFVGGWSAGGHLAVVAADHPAVSGVISISGLFDLEPISLTYINRQLGLQPAEIERLAPIRKLPARKIPIALFVGELELPELQRQSRAFEQRARSVGLPVTINRLAGHNHYTIMEELAAPDGALTRGLLNLIEAAGGNG